MFYRRDIFCRTHPIYHHYLFILMTTEIYEIDNGRQRLRTRFAMLEHCSSAMGEEAEVYIIRQSKMNKHAIFNASSPASLLDGNGGGSDRLANASGGSLPSRAGDPPHLEGGTRDAVPNSAS